MFPKVVVIDKDGIEKWAQTEEYNHHLSRLIDSKPTISMSNSIHDKYLKCKRASSSENKLKEINSENRRLLKSLVEIIKKPMNLYSERKQKSTLNGSKRKNDLIRITKENHALLKRLESMTSNYVVKKFPSKTPLKIIKSHKSYSSMRCISKTSENGKLLLETDKLKLPYNYTNNHNIMSKCTIFHKKLKKCGDNYYFIEVKLSGGKLKITAMPTKSPAAVITEFSVIKSMNYANYSKEDNGKASLGS